MGEVNYRRELQRLKRIRALEDAVIRETDEVIGLFHQSEEHAQSGMKTQVLYERETPKAVKIYDGETGTMTKVVRKEADEYPCLRAIAMGFLLCMAVWLVALFVAGVI